MQIYNKNIVSYLYMLISTASISLSTFFAKICMISHVPLSVTVFSRFFIPFIMIIIIFININFFTQIAWTGLKSYLYRAICLLLSQALLFMTMSKLSLSEAFILYTTGPIFIAIYDTFSGYRFCFSEVLSLMLGLFGAALMLGIQDGVFNKYILVGLLSGLMLAMSQILLHKSSRREHNLNVMFFIYFFTSIISFFPAIIFHPATEAISTTYNFGIVTTLILAGIFSFFNQFFRGKAYSFVSTPSILSPLIYFSVLVSIVLDLTYFKIFPDSEIILGGSFIIISSYLATKRKRQNAQ